MSSDQSRIIESLVEFLAHALELEEASVEHYEELADSMEIHNNPAGGGAIPAHGGFQSGARKPGPGAGRRARVAGDLPLGVQVDLPR